MKRKFVKIVAVSLIVLGAAGIFFRREILNWQMSGQDDDLIVDGETFMPDMVTEKARKLAETAFQKPDNILPAELKELNYDQYRDIRFVRENGPWYNKGLTFEVQFFHPGAIFENSVAVNEIIRGRVKKIRYSPEYFNYGKNRLDGTKFENMDYAGFRLHYPINSQTYYDELISFLGASYFRALGKGQKYGLSARGLAIDTAVQTGEEFPIFKEFWIERPQHGAAEIKIYALLDSPSVTGAYSFTIQPGLSTTIDVDAKLFPRKKINKLGIAPLTSMFLFGENNKHMFDDHRPEVHDSDGLLLWNGNNEWLWRPLDNSKYLRISSFIDNNPKGFGLMQRDRRQEHYLDFEAYYEQRPSVWVEPLDDWGKGEVQLVEIPSEQEIHDNIVAYWIPQKEVEAGQEYRFRYRLHWTGDVPIDSHLAKITSTYTGVGGVSGTTANDKRKFVVDFSNPGLNNLKQMIEDGKIIPEVTISEGKLLGTHVIYNPVTKGATLYMDFRPNGKTSEIRISLAKDGKTFSEIWSYQWLP